MRGPGRAVLLLTAGMLAAASGGATAAAEDPGGAGSSGGTVSPSPPASPSPTGSSQASSSCARPGVQQVPMLQGAVELGLPLQVDPATRTVTVTDAVVCYHAGAGDSASSASGEAVVVQAPDDQGPSLRLGASCASDQRATLRVDCAPTAEPLVVVNPSDDSTTSAGAGTVGLDVAVPIQVCAAGHCAQGSPELVPAVIAGRLECSAPPADGAPTATGAVCLWYGLQVSADGVPVTGLAPSDAGTGPVSAGGWAEAPLAGGAQLVTVDDACDPRGGDLTDCHVDATQRYLWLQYGRGPVLVYVVPGGETPLLVAAADPGVSASACYQTAGLDACPPH